MSRSTHCLTWGGPERREHVSFRMADGSTGCATIAEVQTICGRWGDDYNLPPGDTRRRPKGVCVACWRQMRADIARMDAPAGGDCAGEVGS